MDSHRPLEGIPGQDSQESQRAPAQGQDALGSRTSVADTNGQRSGSTASSSEAHTGPEAGTSHPQPTSPAPDDQTRQNHADTQQPGSVTSTTIDTPSQQQPSGSLPPTGATTTSSMTATEPTASTTAGDNHHTNTNSNTTNSTHDANNHDENDHGANNHDPNDSNVPANVPANVAPGPRATRLQELFATSLAHSLKKVSVDNLAACYPTIAANAPTLLRDLRARMVERLEERCHQEFQRILANRNVVPKLNELEHRIAEAGERRSQAPEAKPPTPPHLLPPEQVLMAHLARPLAAQHATLQARLQATQTANEEVYARLLQQRTEIHALLDVVERVTGDVDAANTLLVTVAQDVAVEAREAQQSLAAYER